MRNKLIVSSALLAIFSVSFLACYKTSVPLTSVHIEKRDLYNGVLNDSVFSRSIVSNLVSTRGAFRTGNVLDNSIGTNRSPLPGNCCRVIFDGSSSLRQVDRNNASCSSGTVILKYIVTFKETVCSNSSFTYAFNLRNVNVSSSKVTDLGFENVCDGGSNSCYNFRYFEVSFVVPASSYEQRTTDFLDISLNQTCGTVSNLSILSSFVKDYCVSLPSVNVGVLGQDFIIGSECSTLCVSNNAVCPSSIIFRYRIAGSSAWTTVSLPTIGGTISTGLSGLVEYEVSCSYSTPYNCSSLVFSDSVVM